MENKERTFSQRPFLEDFTIEEINIHLDTFLEVVSLYSREDKAIKLSVDFIKQGYYPGVRESNKISDYFSYSDFIRVFDSYLEKNFLDKNIYSSNNCRIVFEKLLWALKEKRDSKIENQIIINIINELKNYTKELLEIEKPSIILKEKIELEENKELNSFITGGGTDLEDRLGDIFGKETEVEIEEEKIRKIYKYKISKGKKVIIYNKDLGKMLSFNLLGRIKNITILKDNKGNYFLREYRKKPIIEVDLINGFTFNAKNKKQEVFSVIFKIDEKIGEITVILN